MLTPEQHEYADTVRRSGEALLAIINDILDFSKIEAGKLDLEIIDFNLREMIEDVLELLAEQAHGKGLELTALLRDDVPDWVAGDPVRLRQILTNLVGNAVKFTTQGEVVVHVRSTVTGAHKTVLHFAITDTGIGIAPDAQGHLFQPFTQADASTTRRFGGSGLGLAICKRLVAHMEGEIGLESTPGQGSTFWFTAALSPRPAPPMASQPDNVTLRGIRVLCVDDNATHRAFLEARLRAWGMRAEGVSSAEAALERLRSAQAAGHPYALGILDSRMPEMDGISLARAIKAAPLTASTTLVLLTLAVQRGGCETATAADFAASITKPIRQSQLYHCLLTVMSAAPTLPAPPAAQPLSARPQAASGTRILLAEDNVANQKVAVRMLEKLGCHVDVVVSGTGAVEASRQAPYHLLFMDCHMPEMDGYAATTAIRRRERQTGQHVPIVALTANAMEGDRERCLDAGMDDYLSKPFQAEDLLIILQKWVVPAR